ncbi:MAG: hypothetical protein QM817_34400 [Archangium sp.]
MSQAKVVRPCVMDAQLAVRRAERQLCEVQGYVVEKRHPGEARVELRYAKGSSSSLHSTETKHHLEVSSNGRELTFVFTSGIAASGYVTKGERLELGSRADAAVAATSVEEEKPRRVGCKQCGKLTDTSAATCAHCGSADFY